LATAIAFLVLTAALTTTVWGAPKYKVLHAFTGGKDGGGLWGSLVLDTKGNVYGTTSGGGAHDHGVVFKLALAAKAGWSETVLHNFPSSVDDGQGPTSSLTLDASDNLYGTTVGGGTTTAASFSSWRMTPEPRAFSTTSAPSPNAATGGHPTLG
jgi:uncharacterized repeat protein (TIGR03803 family)